MEYYNVKELLKEAYTDEILSDIERLNKIFKPLKDLKESIEPSYKFFYDLANKLYPLLEKIKENSKLIAKISIENGFYPSPLMKISLLELQDCKDNNDIENYLSIKIQSFIDDENNKKALLEYYIKYNKWIEEIFKLYENGNYRLCILSILNILSIIFNDCFDNKDFQEKQEIEKQITKKGINLDDQYLLLSPYIDDANNKIINTLTKNYRSNPEEYSKFSYNRNAIVHGYSKNFGTKTNCLRWFSVFISTFELMCGFNLYDFKI